MSREALQGISVVVDGIELKFVQSAIDEVADANALVDYTGFLFSRFHFDDEEFPDASQRVMDKLKECIDYLKKVPPDGENARDALGEGLHTLQDFYSHSTWVEAKNTGINTMLGRGIISKPSVNDFFCPTQRSTLSLPTSSGATLTSGYYLGLSLTCNPPTGKCAHGEPINCFFTGGDGINKDSPTTPDRGHIAARSLAVKASIDFVNQVLTTEGIYGNTDRIEALMGIEKSLTVCIDTTGSMGEEIAGIRQQVLSIVNSYKQKGVPPNFVLVPFSDPSVGPVFRTKKPDVFLAAVNKLIPSGGDDCPEMAMGGLLLAVDASVPNSAVLLFTDASAKDASLASTVIANARKKRIRISAVLTGTCSPIDPAYISVVEETGGQLFFSTSGAQIAQVFNLVRLQLEGEFVTLARIKDSLSTPNTYKYLFPVDSSLTRIIVSTSFESGVGSWTLNMTRPNGTFVKTSDPDVNFTAFGFDFTVVVESPTVGLWSFSLIGSGTFTTLVQGNSPINLDTFKFVALTNQTRHEPAFVQLQGNPIRGAVTLGIVKLFTSVKSATFSIVDEKGKITNNTVETISDNPFFTKYITKNEILLKLDVPDFAFGLIITGQNEAGQAYQRIYPQVFVPQNIKISFDEATRPDFLASFESTNLTFIVENLGTNVTEVRITAVEKSSRKKISYIEDVSPKFTQIPSFASIIVTLVIRPDICIQDNPVSFTVTASASGTIIANSETVVIITSCTKPLTFAPIFPSPSPSSTPSLAPSEIIEIEFPSPSPSSTPSLSPSEIIEIEFPSPSPSSTPSLAPSEISTPSHTICFSGKNLVEIKDYGYIPISQVQIGDFVKAGNDQYSQVYGFGHFDHHYQKGRYLRLIFHSNRSNHALPIDALSLEISPRHIVFVDVYNNTVLMRAANVVVGDILSGKQIKSITTVVRHGVYAPLTQSGDIVVSGILASNYVEVLDLHELWNQHDLGHFLFLPRRWFCYYFMETCKNEVYINGYGILASLILFVSSIINYCQTVVHVYLRLN